MHCTPSNTYIAKVYCTNECILFSQFPRGKEDLKDKIPRPQKEFRMGPKTKKKAVESEVKSCAVKKSTDVQVAEVSSRCGDLLILFLFASKLFFVR